MSSTDHALPLFLHLWPLPPTPEFFPLTGFLVPHVNFKENAFHVFLIGLHVTPQKMTLEVPLSPPPPTPLFQTGGSIVAKAMLEKGCQLPSGLRGWAALSQHPAGPCCHWSGNVGRGGPGLCSFRAAPQWGSKHPGASQEERVSSLSASLPLQPLPQCCTAVFL